MKEPFESAGNQSDSELHVIERPYGQPESSNSAHPITPTEYVSTAVVPLIKQKEIKFTGLFDRLRTRLDGVMLTDCDWTNLHCTRSKFIYGMPEIVRRSRSMFDKSELAQLETRFECEESTRTPKMLLDRKLMQENERTVACRPTKRFDCEYLESKRRRSSLRSPGRRSERPSTERSGQQATSVVVLSTSTVPHQSACVRFRAPSHSSTPPLFN